MADQNQYYPFSLLQPSSSKMIWSSTDKQIDDKYNESLPITPITQSFMDATASWNVNPLHDNGDLMNSFGSGNGYRSNDPILSWSNPFGFGNGIGCEANDPITSWMNRSDEPDDLTAIVRSCSYYPSAGRPEEYGVAGREGRGSSSGGASNLTSVVCMDDAGSSTAGDAKRQVAGVGKEVMSHTRRREEDSKAGDSINDLLKKARRSENNTSISAPMLQLPDNVDKFETQKSMLPPKFVSWNDQRLSLNLENNLLNNKQQLSAMSVEKKHMEAPFGLLRKEREMLQTSFALQQQQQQQRILKMQQKKHKQLKKENKLLIQNQQLQKMKLHKPKQSQQEEQTRMIRQQLQEQLRRDLQQLLETQFQDEEEEEQQRQQQQSLKQQQQHQQSPKQQQQQQSPKQQQQQIEQEQRNEQEPLMKDLLSELHLDLDIDLDFFNSF